MLTYPVQLYHIVWDYQHVSIKERSKTYPMRRACSSFLYQPPCTIQYLVSYNGISTNHNHHKHRTDAALQHPEEEALGIQRLIVVARRCQDETNPPNCNRERGHMVDGVSLRESHSRVRADNEP